MLLLKTSGMVMSRRNPCIAIVVMTGKENNGTQSTALVDTFAFDYIGAMIFDSLLILFLFHL